jgi:TonB-dependent receptor
MDWTFALSSASLFEPDKRQFGTVWYPEKKVFIPGFGFFGPNDEHRKLAPDANINFGNLQRTWKDISEESQQYTINFKIPFEQWSGDEGYVKVGLFHDQVDRKYDQESFGNFGTLDVPPIPQSYEAPFHERWSLVFPSEGHLLEPADLDVDYTGEQEISAWYWMMDLPLNNWLNLIGGVRYETTHLSIINDPEPGAFWFPAGALTETNLNPGDADVGIKETDILPSIGFVYSPFEQLTLRGSYSETIARQTFKELTPILQQEYLGGDVFIGNPHLQMSSLKNYDLRLDYEPYQGGLVSASYFFKDIRNPIEYVQRAATFTFTEPVNFPEGQLSGFEIEIRQNMGHFWPQLDGLSIGANATLIDSQVTLPRADSNDVGRELNAIGFPISRRDMVNAPEYLYNLYLRYEYEPTGTQLGLFYTVKGDTLVAGDGVARKTSYVPAVYAREYGTLNFSLSQMLGEHFKLKFSAKNLTDPQIQEVYRSPYIDGDVVKTSYTKGIDLSVSLSASFEF